MDYIETAVAGKNCHAGLVLEDRTLYLVGFVLADIRRIADDEVEIMNFS